MLIPKDIFVLYYVSCQLLALSNWSEAGLPTGTKQDRSKQQIRRQEEQHSCKGKAVLNDLQVASRQLWWQECSVVSF